MHRFGGVERPEVGETGWNPTVEDLRLGPKLVGDGGGGGAVALADPQTTNNPATVLWA